MYYCVPYFVSYSNDGRTGSFMEPRFFKTFESALKGAINYEVKYNIKVLLYNKIDVKRSEPLYRYYQLLNDAKTLDQDILKGQDQKLQYKSRNKRFQVTSINVLMNEWSESKLKVLEILSDNCFNSLRIDIRKIVYDEDLKNQDRDPGSNTSDQDLDSNTGSEAGSEAEADIGSEAEAEEKDDEQNGEQSEGEDEQTIERNSLLAFYSNEPVFINTPECPSSEELRAETPKHFGYQTPVIYLTAKGSRENLNKNNVQIDKEHH